MDLVVSVKGDVFRLVEGEISVGRGGEWVHVQSCLLCICLFDRAGVRVESLNKIK